MNQAPTQYVSYSYMNQARLKQGFGVLNPPLFFMLPAWVFDESNPFIKSVPYILFLRNKFLDFINIFVADILSCFHYP